MGIKRVVLTGTVSTGKTTIIRKLRGRGLSIIPEVAQWLIDDWNITPDNLRFDVWQAVVEHYQIKNYYIPENGLYFYDRGIPDDIAFRHVRDMEFPKYLRGVWDEFRYDYIFFFPFDERIYNDDMHWQRAKRIDGCLKKTYRNLGYNLDVMPKSNPTDRVNYILKKMSGTITI